MAQRLINMLKQITAAWLLLFIAAYYVDLHFFTHAHIIKGVTIVHSHVHDKHHHETNEGGHTTSEITLIATLSGQLLTIGDQSSVELKRIDKVLQTLGVERKNKVRSVHLCCSTLRAPPAC